MKVLENLGVAATAGVFLGLIVISAGGSGLLFQVSCVVVVLSCALLK